MLSDGVDLIVSDKHHTRGGPIAGRFFVTTAATCMWARSGNALAFRSTSINGSRRAASIRACTLASIRYGTAATFGEARAGFEVAWCGLQPNIPDGAFEEWRHSRDWTEQKYAMWARGEKLPSEVFSTMMRCVCGMRFDSWKPAESYDHRGHIYAAERQGIHW